jgi:hypothetical protein
MKKHLFFYITKTTLNAHLFQKGIIYKNFFEHVDVCIRYLMKYKWNKILNECIDHSKLDKLINERIYNIFINLIKSKNVFDFINSRDFNNEFNFMTRMQSDEMIQWMNHFKIDITEIMTEIS